VHPPGGVAGGDTLELAVDARRKASALLTTPGAGKLYKSAGRVASQRVRLGAHDAATIEWLPQETIVFDAADADLSLEVDVAPGALVLAWEIATLGREAMGESFGDGRLRTRLTVRRGGRLALDETGEVRGGSAWLASPVGWRGERASGSFVAAGRAIGDALVDACREALAAWPATAAVSRLAPDLLAVRYLGPTAADGRSAFVAAWSALRPALAGRAAVPPRIWAT
jgi:urease accessory protein